jgi:hypothetical protein
MLLKDADALDRARLGEPGSWGGCDPSRLRLPVLMENTLILQGCLDLSVVLTTLLIVFEPHPEVFYHAAAGFIQRLSESENDLPEDLCQAVHLIIDRFTTSAG